MKINSLMLYQIKHMLYPIKNNWKLNIYVMIRTLLIFKVILHMKVKNETNYLL